MSSASPDGGSPLTGMTGTTSTPALNPSASTMDKDAFMAIADHPIIALVRWVGKVPIVKLVYPCQDVIMVPANMPLSATVTMDILEPTATFVRS
jgi:hypothetical protein